MRQNTPTTDELEDMNGVVRAVDTWGDCDVAILFEDGANVGPARRGRNVAEITDFEAAPYTLFKLN